MKTIKGKGRKLLAAALSLLMLVGLLPVSAFAAGSSVTVTFAYLYQSDGSQIMYQDTFVGTHATNGGAGHPAVQIYADGEEAYCIEPGEHLLTGDVLTENASEAWNSLGYTKQEAIKMALAFGKPGNAGGLIGSGDAKHLATQMIVWEFVCGYRDAASYALLDNCIYNAFCKNGANAEVAASYNAIAQAIRNWDVTPSFANGRTYEMSYENGKYVVSLNDSNDVLGSFSVMSSDSNVKISKAGNTLTLTCDSYLDAEPTIIVQKSSNISASAVLVPYGIPSLQDIVVGMARIEDVSASFKVSTVGGTLKLVKNSEDGIVDGIEFTITGSGYNKVVTSGRDGTVSLEGLVPGTYTISEAPASYYEPQEAKTVTIVSGETATVTFNNTLKRGSLSVSKASEDGFTEGMKFRLSGISASGSAIDLYATTDSTGVATFNDVLIAGVGGYTLEEVDTAVRYVIPEDQNVTVTWKDMTGATVNNVLKKFDVTVVKSDAETGAAQGDATLVGAVYGLYRDGTLVKEYTAKRKAHLDALKEAAENDPEAAAELAAIRKMHSDATKKSYAKRKEKAAEDPELAAKIKAKRHAGYERRKEKLADLKVRAETDPAAAEELAAFRAYHVEASTRSRKKLLKDAETDPDAADRLAQQRERRNERQRQARADLTALAETDPEAAEKLTALRTKELEYSQQYIARLKELAKTDPEAAARLEAHREYNRQYLRDYHAKKRTAEEKEFQNVTA